MHINRRNFIKQSMVMAGMCLLPKFVYGQAHKINIGVYAPSHCSLPVILADIKGLFKKTGVDVKVVYMDGMPEIIKALNKGDIQFGQLISPISFALQAGAAGLPKIDVSVTQVLGVNGGVLGVAADADIKQLVDLKGKTIGVHNKLMVHYQILTLVLEKCGLVPEKDVNIMMVPMNQIATALSQKQIHGFINPEPLPTFLENEHISKTLLLTRMFWTDHPCCLLCTKTAFMEQEKQLVQDVSLACMIAGLELDSVASRKPAIEEIHKMTPQYNSIPIEQILKAFQNRRSDFYPFPYQSAGLVIAEQMKKMNILPNQINAESLVQKVFQSEFAMNVMKLAVPEIKGSIMPTDLKRIEQIKIS